MDQLLLVLVDPAIKGRYRREGAVGYIRRAGGEEGGPEGRLESEACCHFGIGRMCFGNEDENEEDKREKKAEKIKGVGE